MTHPDFDIFLNPDGTAKVREQLYPESRGHEWHYFETYKEAKQFVK